MQDGPTDQPTHPDPGSGGVDPEDVPRRRLGDFDLLSELGRGGMGIVYEARQRSLNRRVALKVLPPGLGLTEQAVQRFEREAHAAARLHHTNIVPVYATGQDDGCHYYAMELIEGRSLFDVLEELSGSGSNPLMGETATAFDGGQHSEVKSGTGQAISGAGSLSEEQTHGRKWFDTVAKLLAEVADALEYAHGRGVIHRDIKPANLMLSPDGRLCITDFGLARVAQEPRMTVSGAMLGTPAYMSPEQVASARMMLDHRTDVYSLGAVLYEMLTHRRPFPGVHRDEILRDILTREPRPPRRIDPRIPLDLETICRKAMEKNPDERYATAGELAEDLRLYLGHGLIRARRAGIAKRLWKSTRRHPVAATITVGVIAVVLLGSIAQRLWVGRSEEALARQLSDARLQFTRGEFREALGGVEAILSAQPGNIDALLIRARIRFQQYRHVECVDDAGEVLQQDPDNWEAHMLIAAAAGKARLYSVPVERHRAVADAKGPDTPDASYLRGWQERGRGNTREAIRWFTEALTEDPGHALALEARSDAYVSLRDLPAALQDAERLIVAVPKNPIGYQQKSGVLLRMHDEEASLEAANRAIELDPDNPLGYQSRAALHGSRGETSKRIDDLTRVIALDPRRFGALLVRGQAYRSVGRYEEAVSDLSQCIEIYPDDAGCYQELFGAHLEAGRKEDAVDVLKRVEARAGEWTGSVGTNFTTTMWMDYYVATGNLERAEEEAERLIELIPQGIAGYQARIAIRHQMDGEAVVEEDCDRLTSLEFELPNQYCFRANLLRHWCDRMPTVLADYTTVIEMAPSWADPYFERALLHETGDDLDRALEDMEKAVELAPNWKEAADNLTRLREKAGSGVDERD